MSVNFTLITAVSQNGVIGVNGKLAWTLRDDLEDFFSKTKGHTLVMGRKTFQSLPKKLKNRTVIVLTSQPLQDNNVLVAHTVEEFFRLIPTDEQEVFIAGGRKIYEVFLPFASSMSITHVDTQIEGENLTKLPEIDFNDWDQQAEKFYPSDQNNQHSFTIRLWKRKTVPGILCAMENSRPENLAAMESLDEARSCPFCWSSIWQDGTRRPVLYLGKWWLVTFNQYPYQGTRHHFLFIYRDHLPYLNHPSIAIFPYGEEAMAELGILSERIIQDHRLPSLSIAMRIGDMRYNGGSLSHPHIHLISGNCEPNSPTVKVKLVS